jgi:hypothetical protein
MDIDDLEEDLIIDDLNIISMDVQENEAKKGGQ